MDSPGGRKYCRPEVWAREEVVSKQRFTTDFKEEAVRQLIEWGQSVAETSALN